MRLREHEGIIPGRIDIRYCRPDAITVEEGYNVRDLTTAEARAELDELKAQVKEHGVITPLKIRFNGEQIILVEGHRRRMVVLELIAEFKASDGTEGRNIEAVPIFAEPPGTTVEERDAGLFISNTGTRLKPLEFANLIYRMHTVRGMPLEAVAKQLGISMPVLKNHLEMRGMSEPIKEHIRKGDISATLARNIAKGVDPEEAEKMIQANLDENRRIKGAKKSHKVTAKTLKRGKADKLPVPERAPRQSEIAGETTAAESEQKQSAAIVPMIGLAPVSKDFARHMQQTMEADSPTAVVNEVKTDIPQHQSAGIKDLISALAPFAKIVPDFDPECPDEHVILISDLGHEITAGQCRTAWRAWNAATGGSDVKAA